MGLAVDSTSSADRTWLRKVSFGVGTDAQASFAPISIRTKSGSWLAATPACAKRFTARAPDTESLNAAIEPGTAASSRSLTLSTSGFVPVAHEFFGQSRAGPVGQPGPSELYARVIESPSAAITLGGFVALAGATNSAKPMTSDMSAATVRRGIEVLITTPPWANPGSSNTRDRPTENELREARHGYEAPVRAADTFCSVLLGSYQACAVGQTRIRTRCMGRLRGRAVVNLALLPMLQPQGS